MSDSVDANLNRTVKGAAAAILSMVLASHSSSQPVIAPGSPSSIFVSSTNFPNALKTYEAKVFGSSTPYDDVGSIPTFGQVYSFIHALFKRAQIEPECVIASALYLTRVISSTPDLVLCGLTWRRLTFTSLVISSKMHDDVSCSSSSFAMCSYGDFTVRQLNSMEAWFLMRLSFNLYLTPEDYRTIYYALKTLWTSYGTSDASPEELASLPPIWSAHLLFSKEDQLPAAKLPVTAAAERNFRLWRTKSR